MAIKDTNIFMLKELNFNFQKARIFSIKIFY